MTDTTSDPDYGNNIAAAFRGYVDRIVRLQEEMKDLQSDCAEVYKEAKGAGFDKNGIKSVVARLRMDLIDRQAQEFFRDAYWLLYQGKTEVLLQGPPVRPENAEPEPEKAASETDRSPAPATFRRPDDAATSNGAGPEAAPAPEKPKKVRKAKAKKVDVRTPEPEEPELPMAPAVETEDTGMPEDLLDLPFDPETGEVLDPNDVQMDPDGNPPTDGTPEPDDLNVPDHPAPETVGGLLDHLPEPIPEADQPPPIPAGLRRKSASEAAAEQIAAAKASAPRAPAPTRARARAEPEEPDLPDGF